MSYGEFEKPHTVYYYEQSATAVEGLASRPALQINAYTLPATGLLTICVNQVPEGSVQGSLADITGKVWKQWGEWAGANYKKRIEVSELPAGIYFVRLSGSRFTGVK